MPEACARECNAGLFDAALYVGHGCMGWHALTIRAADENLLDLSIATKGGLACRSVVVSRVPAAAAGVEFARLEDAKVGPFLPGARVTCVMLVITRGQSPFLIGLRRQVQFQRSVLGVHVHEVRPLAREARGHHVNLVQLLRAGIPSDGRRDLRAIAGIGLACGIRWCRCGTGLPLAGRFN